MNNQSVTINKYLPIAILYFFLNGFLLPLGMLYTTLLTPFLIIWLVKYPTIKYVPLFFIFMLPFVVVHFKNGVEYWYYLKSLLLFFSVFIFGLAFYQFLETCQSLRVIYKNIILINGAMVLVSLILLFVPRLELVFWNDNQMSLGNVSVRRLKMLTYEPSYYSTLFAPFAMYYLLKIFRKELPNPVLYGALVIIPLILSMSFGVIFGIAIAFFLLAMLHIRKILLTGNNLLYVLSALAGLIIVFLVLLIFFPDNVFFLRITNTLSGGDQSFNGRTLDSFILGSQIANVKSLAWGCGLGQVKLIGVDFFKAYYNYDRFTPADIGIPNNLGDILATFGIIGVIIKLFLEFYLFFKTKVYQNYYRLTLFLFIFIYQFTGSYIMNIAEYVIWILAFKENLFPEFNKPVFNRKRTLKTAVQN